MDLAELAAERRRDAPVPADFVQHEPRPAGEQAEREEQSGECEKALHGATHDW